MENKVKIRIFGQEYTIVGDSSKEDIIRVGNYVDETINKIYESSKMSALSSLAVLAAINIALELFSIKREDENYQKELERKEEKIQQYKQLWEEAKIGFDSYKDENQKNMEQNQDLFDQLKEAREVAEQAITKSIKDELSEEKADEIQAIKNQYKDLENSFFDLQMENIQLKNELDKLKELNLGEK